jgi:hypothetical protein
MNRSGRKRMKPFFTFWAQISISILSLIQKDFAQPPYNKCCWAFPKNCSWERLPYNNRKHILFFFM